MSEVLPAQSNNATPETRASGAQPGNQNRLVHGYARKRNMSPTYLVWTDMKRRCQKTTHPAFKWYGARGITVCDRWLDFQCFLSDMGDKPKGLTLDRIDNAKGYEPSNCKWSTRLEQSNNQSRNHLITVNGLTLNVAQWSRHTGIPTTRIHQRLALGWTETEAVTNTKRYARRN